MDVHEVFLTKHDVEKHPEIKDLINNAANCVLVHHRCHMLILGHGGDLGLEKCAAHLIQHEGRDRIEEFLLAMRTYIPTGANNALKRLEAIKS